MNLGGWIFMISSLALVIGVTLWCYIRVMTVDEPVCDDDAGNENSPAG
ncbi:MAG: hypothetical protein Kow0074_25250 [Candidatus Zixiibacteriota bacterium]